MASIFGGRRYAEAGAGAKILRNRKAPPGERTPYARPKPPEPPAEYPENPNWLAGLIYPARLIATGAGKIISTVLGPDSPSSSSSSLVDSDSGSHDDESEDDLSNHDIQTNKELSSPTTKSGNKILIEQLVSQEEFSREESEELIKLIESRVMDGRAPRLNKTDNRSHDVRNCAIKEAKKWLQEKNLGSGSMLRTDHHGCLSATLPTATEAVVSSPVEVAKSYMQTRPPWASPSLKYVEFRTPSPKLLQQSMGEPPMSIFSSSLQSSELKRSSLATGSWNILEEIRKVRSKATEELLASISSQKIDAPLFASEQKSSKGSLANNINELEYGDRLHNFNSAMSDLETIKFTDLGAQDDPELPIAADSSHDRTQNEALLMDAANSVLEQNEDWQANKNITDKADSANSTLAFLSQKQFAEAKANGKDGLEQSKANGLTDCIAENGLPISASRLPLQVDADQNQDLGTRDHAEIRNVSTLNEDVSLGSGSEESTSLQLEELSQDSSGRNTKQRLAAKNNKTPAQIRKTRGYTRGVRGREK